MIDFTSILIIIAALINAFLVVWVYFKKKGNASIFWFSAFVTALVIWCIAILGTRIAQIIQSPMQTILGRLIYGSGLLIATSLFVFANVFPRSKYKLSRKLKLATFTPLGLLFILTIFTSYVIKHISLPMVGKNIVQFGPVYPIYFFYMTSCLLVALYLLFRTYRRSTGITRAQALYVFLGILFTVLVGGTTNLILPTFGYLQLWAVMGPFSTLFVIFFVIYTILKHHLLGLKVVGIEILAGLIVLVSLVDVILSKSWHELLFRIPLFVLVTSFASLLIRGVFKELEQAQKLQKANARLRELDKLKTLFLSIASHQLRTPLTAIKGFVSMIMEGNLGKIPAKVKETSEDIYDNTNRLIRLVETFLNVSRIESGKFTINKETQDLVPIVKKILDELRLTAEYKEVELSFAAKVNSLTASVDVDKIEDVLINLIDNAVKYTQKRGSVKVKLLDLGNRVRFEVKDTGQGLKESEIKLLFSKFVRGKTASQTSSGTGIGLYIAKRIIQAHQGEIGVESPGYGKGSTFWFEIAKNT